MKRQSKPKPEKKQKTIDMPAEERQEEIVTNYFCPHFIEDIRRGTYRFGQCKFMQDYRNSLLGA